jgi:hypothetical protein
MILQRPDVRASGRLARFSALCPLVLASLTYADVVAWDETTSGDISSNRLDPTRVGLVAGVNVIRGAMGPTAVPDVHDLDYITVTVPEGHRLEALVLREADVEPLELGEPLRDAALLSAGEVAVSAAAQATLIGAAAAVNDGSPASPSHPSTSRSHRSSIAAGRQARHLTGWPGR